MKRSHLHWINTLNIFVIYAIISAIIGLCNGDITAGVIYAIYLAPMLFPISFILSGIVGSIIVAIMEAKGKEIIDDCYDDRSWEVRNLEEKAFLCDDPKKSAELYAKAKELDLLEKMSKK